MTTDRIKEIQEGTACPNSKSVQQALLQVWNECEQQKQSEIDSLTKALELWKNSYTEMNKKYIDKADLHYKETTRADLLQEEVERLRKERYSSLKEKMYFNRMKEIVSKVAYDFEHYNQKTYEVLRNDAVALLEEYKNNQNK